MHIKYLRMLVKSNVVRNHQARSFGVVPQPPGAELEFDVHQHSHSIVPSRILHCNHGE
jgi:hypothetical protein